MVVSLSSKQQWNWPAGDPGHGRYSWIFFHRNSECSVKCKATLKIAPCIITVDLPLEKQVNEAHETTFCYYM